MQTNSQRMAQAAWSAVDRRLKRASKEEREKFTSFAREFPTLVHSCGLAQAVTFARAQREGGHQECYVSDLAAVLQAGGHSDMTSKDKLAEETRNAPVTKYIRLSRDALLAAVWLKRYVEAAGKQPASSGGK